MRRMFAAAGLYLIALGLVPLALTPLAAQAQQVQPGQWSSTGKITHMEGPGLPPQMVQSMMSAPPTTNLRCVDAKDAAAGLAQMMSGKNQDCTVTGNSFAGGVLDLTRSCKAGLVVHLRGPVTPTSISLDVTSTDPRGMKMAMTFTAKRIGACK